MEKHTESVNDTEDVKALTEKELTEKILAEAKVISDGMDTISESIALTSECAVKYEGTVADAAIKLRKETCPHINALIDDMEKAIKV